MTAHTVPPMHGPWAAPDPDTTRIMAAHTKAARAYCYLGVLDPWMFPAFQYRRQGPHYRFNLPYTALTRSGRFARLNGK